GWSVVFTRSLRVRGQLCSPDVRRIISGFRFFVGCGRACCVLTPVLVVPWCLSVSGCARRVPSALRVPNPVGGRHHYAALVPVCSARTHPIRRVQRQIRYRTVGPVVGPVQPVTVLSRCPVGR